MSLSIVFQENCTVMDTVNEMYLTTDFQTSNTSNVSDPDELLRKLNDELALRYLPVIIYMLLLIIYGNRRSAISVGIPIKTVSMSRIARLIIK
jgi:hypothetical protein